MAEGLGKALQKLPRGFKSLRHLQIFGKHMAKANKKTLNQIVEILKQELNPARIFLFGSQANGTARKDSDYDFVVVTKTPKKSSIDEMARVSILVYDKLKVSSDIFIYSKREFIDWKDEFSSIPEVALNTGKELSF